MTYTHANVFHAPLSKLFTQLHPDASHNDSLPMTTTPTITETEHPSDRPVLDGLARPIQLGGQASMKLTTPFGTEIIFGVIRHVDGHNIELCEGNPDMGVYYRAHPQDIRMFS